MTAAHAVQTSTLALGGAYRPHNPEVALFPNCAFELQPFPARTGPLRVFLGALNRERMTGRVAAALAGFCAAHPEAEFAVMHDRAFFDALPTARRLLLPQALARPPLRSRSCR